MDGTGLTCALHLHPAGPGVVRVGFRIRNAGQLPVVVGYFQPFVDFDLSARTQDGELPIVRPAYDIGVQAVELTIGPDETLALETPIRIVFDPTVPPSGGAHATTWTLRHVPTTVHLTAVAHLRGAELPPCEAVLDPTRTT
jgi:hypothetical protein